jgi:hypothetical protein
MRIYLAARYSRRLELCGYRKQLLDVGHVVQACWLDGQHQIDDHGEPIGDHGEAMVEGDDESTSLKSAALRSKFAHEDVRDVLACEVLVAFTEPPRSNHSRGGRHVELGIAIGGRKQICVVGHRENLFCWHEAVRFFQPWEEFFSEYA